jgi:hypothetical protein
LCRRYRNNETIANNQEEQDMGGVAWKIRAVMLLQVAAAALAAWLANAVLGGDVNAWLATFGVLAVFTALLGVLLEKSLVGRLNALRAVIAGMYGDGDLTRRAAVEGRDEMPASPRTSIA